MTQILRINAAGQTLRRVAPQTYVAGGWKVWAGIGRASNKPTWHVEHAGVRHSSYESFAAAKAAVRQLRGAL